MKRPNIVLIVADDLGMGDVACFGHSQQTTPHLDTLAASGAQLNNFHGSGPVCSPTRASLFTGRYPQRCGIEGVVSAAGHRHVGLPRSETTFMQILQQAGYATALFGKWHLGYAPFYNPIHFGCDEFRGYVSGNVDYHSHVDQAGFPDWWQGGRLQPETGYVTDLITAHGLDFIDRQSDRPFCLVLAHEAPHYPYQGRCDQADRQPGEPTRQQLGSRSDQSAAYAEMITAYDEGIGQVLATLDRLGLRDDTLVIATVDHGATGPGSNAPFRAGKSTLYEGGIRVPTALSWPARITAGRQCQESGIAMDVFSTVLDAAGCAVPADRPIDGRSWLPLLTAGQSLPERSFCWRFRDWRAVLRGTQKLVAEPGQSWQAFDLAVDPGETQALVEAGFATELSRCWDDWSASVPAAAECVA